MDQVTVAALAMLLASGAPALPDPWSGDVGSISTPVVWKAKPTAEQMKAAYPKGASGHGFVNMSCTLDADGGLSKCLVREETPKGSGFGQAALSLAPLFKVSPDAVQGRSGAAAVNFMLGFRGAPGSDLSNCRPPFCNDGVPPAPSPN